MTSKIAKSVSGALVEGKNTIKLKISLFTEAQESRQGFMSGLIEPLNKEIKDAIENDDKRIPKKYLREIKKHVDKTRNNTYFVHNFFDWLKVLFLMYVIGSKVLPKNGGEDDK